MEIKCKRLATASAAVVFPLLAALYFAGEFVRAEANSAPPYWEGADASGAIVKGDDCPVIVEKETLDLKISTLPSGGEIELSSYCSEAVAEYFFYNPTELDVSMTLLFPFGVFPSYVPSGAEDEVSAVTVDGDRAECRVRYSYAPNSSFDTDRDMGRICDDKKRDAFYREDLPVSEYRFELTAPKTDCVLKLKLSFNPKKTRLLFPADSYARTCIADGDMYAYIHLHGAGKTAVSFYAAGEPLSAIVPKLYDGDVELSGGVDSFEREETTFVRFVDERKGDLPVGEIDWYNAFVDMLNGQNERDGSVDRFELSAGNLMRWYEYEMSIPAKGRAVNRVRAPLYPAVDGRKNSRYMYTYLLSPAAKWADFHKIEINIETPYYLSNSSLGFLENRNEAGGFRYTFSRDSLPQGELTFVLTEKNIGDGLNDGGTNFMLPSLTWAFVTLLILAVIAAVVTVIVVLSLRKKKK